MARKKKRAPENSVPEWVVTYGDLMSLLLCFFILLAAFSELKQPREYRKAIEAINEALGFEGGIGQILNIVNPNNTNINHQRKRANLGGDKSARAQVNEQNIPGRNETVDTLDRGTRWAIAGDFAFDTASTELTPAARRSLDAVAEKIRGRGVKFELRGHAWGVQDEQSGYDLDDLAYQRAKAAKQYLVQQSGIRPELLVIAVAGGAEPRSVDEFNPSAPAANRRVEIIETEQRVSDLHPDPNWQGAERS